ncbi:Platelet-derived growth factor receptor alpha, partial [Orchesella cincta]
MSWEKIGLKFSAFCALLYFSGNVAQGLPANSGRRLSKQQNGDPPTAKIFQVDQNNRILRQWTRINENSETVIQDIDKIRLECTSDAHPVQWLYIGHGAPVLTSNVTFSRIKDRSGEIATEYVATVLINPVKEHHTGKYICSSTDHFDTRTFFYIYVPENLRKKCRKLMQLSTYFVQCFEWTRYYDSKE